MRDFDEYKTIRNADKFLKKDFPKLVLRAGLSPNQIRSKEFSNTPVVNGSRINVNEKMLIDRLDAEEIVNTVVKAMNGYSKETKPILIDYYVNHLTIIELTEKMHLSSTTICKYKNRALLEFVESFIYVKDFHIYNPAP